MKITKAALKQLIREELENSLEEQTPAGPTTDVDPAKWIEAVDNLLNMIGKTSELFPLAALVQNSAEYQKAKKWMATRDPALTKVRHAKAEKPVKFTGALAYKNK